ncbi:MAG TPA: hypothetical protein VHB54_13760 [Mucilaginibacter sp.]|nr:hypothetical protein [Mucilaginibacter sp.]HVW14896.1 hypothetical protein [Mucilaginibacter sp.]
MKKIKQSFVEVIAGQPSKEHYVKVAISVLIISTIIGTCLMLVAPNFNITK